MRKQGFSVAKMPKRPYQEDTLESRADAQKMLQRSWVAISERAESVDSLQPHDCGIDARDDWPPAAVAKPNPFESCMIMQEDVLESIK